MTAPRAEHVATEKREEHVFKTRRWLSACGDQPGAHPDWTASAQSQGPEGQIRDPKQLVQSLRSGGYVILVRHGATFSDQADTDPFNFNDIAKRRNLKEKGEELACSSLM
jgi:hypothetical protein